MKIIANGVIRLGLLPDFGGRIVELTDLRSGRNWLIPGAAEGSSAQDAVFGVEQARGWDECFPSGAACTVAPWPIALRDHGEFWGRSVETHADANRISITGQVGAVIFRRACRLSDDRVTLEYVVENGGDRDLPYLWGQHMLLNLSPGERIDLPGIAYVDAAFLQHRGEVLAPGPLRFPVSDRPGLPDLGCVHGIEERLAAKVFAPVRGDFTATIGGGQGSLEIGWSSDEIGYLGLWLDHGGWPDEGPVRQVCLAPTTAPTESLAAAWAAGLARTLRPGESHRWSVLLRLRT